jgi:nicotinamide phosphoribosyltransferase
VFFGLQYLLKKHLEGRFVTDDHILEANALASAHFGRSGLFNAEGWRHIVKDHRGQLPVRIKAVAEGTPVPVSNVLMTIENTCSKCYWLPNWLETLLVQVWYPMTVATLSREFKADIHEYLVRTGTPELVDFKLHDFGYRGVSSVESAAWGGAAHLVNFKGTDTLAALDLIRKYYSEFCAGHSIPASEHSTITSWGRDHEGDAFENMLDQYTEGPVACVSDSYDIAAAVDHLWGERLRDKILRRNGVLIARPDSGVPHKIVLQCFESLWHRFSGETNVKNYRVLDSHVGVVQGDGVDRQSGGEVMHTLQTHGFSIDPLGFGSGGGLLQKMNRDTFSCAFKCSAVERAGQWQDVWKDPVTDSGKRSKRGRLALIIDEHGEYRTVPEAAAQDGLVDQLGLVFENGELARDMRFADVRHNAALPVPLAV